MIIRLKRFSYSETETEGVLIVGSNKFATIEQPWVSNPNGAKGGLPFQSCVPDGMYRLSPFTRPDESEVWIFFNPSLGVHRFPQDHQKDRGRNLCLIHSANWARQIQGCVAPGLSRLPMADPKTETIAQAVSSSGAAMRSLHKLLGSGPHVLSITSELGASDVV